MLKTLHKLGLDSTEKITVRDVDVAPRDVVAAALPDPATLGERMHGKTCAGTLVTGRGRNGQARKSYLYHVVDNEWSMREYGSQAVVWQTAINLRSRSSCSRPGSGPEPGCSARRRSPHDRSWTSSRSTAPRTASSSSRPMRIGPRDGL